MMPRLKPGHRDPPTPTEVLKLDRYLGGEPLRDTPLLIVKYLRGGGADELVAKPSARLPDHLDGRVAGLGADASGNTQILDSEDKSSDRSFRERQSQTDP